MNIEVIKNEQYTLIKPFGKDFDIENAAQTEKSIATLYGRDGIINFVLDLTNFKSISENGLKLLQKVQKICNNESGLWVIVVNDDDLFTKISMESEEFILILPTVDEAIDAVYMNELENDFKDEHDEEFGGGESDY